MSNEAKKVEQKKKAQKSSVTKYFEQRIERWLESEMAKDEEFAESVRSKPEKTVHGACNYVLEQVRKSGQAGWDDSEVYGMVRHFFDEDELKDPGEQRVQRIVVPGHIDLTDEQKAEAMEKAQEQYLREIREKEAKKEKERIEKERKAADEKRRKLEEKREKELQMQGDLFGMF